MDALLDRMDLMIVIFFSTLIIGFPLCAAIAYIWQAVDTYKRKRARERRAVKYPQFRSF